MSKTVKLTHPSVHLVSTPVVCIVTLRKYAHIRLWSTLEEFKITYDAFDIGLIAIRIQAYSTVVYPLPYTIQNTKYQMYSWEAPWGQPVYYHPLTVPYKGYILWSIEPLEAETIGIYDY